MSPREDRVVEMYANLLTPGECLGVAEALRLEWNKTTSHERRCVLGDMINIFKHSAQERIWAGETKDL